MVSVCFAFQVHQPYRLRNYKIFDVGKSHEYFDSKRNKEVFERVSRKCYLPMNKLWLELLEKCPELKLSFSFSGIVLEQMQEFKPEVLNSFQELFDSKRVEVLEETCAHSLSFLFSKKEFEEQVREHNKTVRKLFGQKPRVFRNTELIYNNYLAHTVEQMGYKGIYSEGADHILQWRSPNFLYKPKTTSSIKLLLKNYRMSDDIAFRFSERSWNEWPLTAEKFAQWVTAVNGNGEIINLFMDYETFGEHQWQDSGIFEFMKRLPFEILKHPDNGFCTPTEAVKKFKPVAELDIHDAISWADIERDLSAWLGNNMQQFAANQLYAMEYTIKESGNDGVLNDWRKLQSSDHFYYMCVKWFSDGDVHKYFNPFDSPYDAFISYANALNDLRGRAKK